MVLIEIIKKYIDSVLVAINSVLLTYTYEFPISYFDPNLDPKETCLGLDDTKRNQIEHHGTGIIELGGMIVHCGLLGTNIHNHSDDHERDFFNNIITPQTKYLIAENIETYLSTVFNVNERQIIVDH